MAVINFLFKSPSWSLLLLESAKFTFDMTSQSQQGSCWKDAARVEFTFTRGLGHISEAAFTICGNPNKVISTGNSMQPAFPFPWPAWLYYYLFFLCELANLEKRWLYISVGQPQKSNVFLEKSILWWKSKAGKTASQSNFKF